MYAFKLNVDVYFLFQNIGEGTKMTLARYILRKRDNFVTGLINIHMNDTNAVTKLVIIHDNDTIVDSGFISVYENDTSVIRFQEDGTR